MKPSDKMQTFVKDIGARHGIDFEAAPIGTYLKLRQPHYDPLVIEKIAVNRVSVAHYYELNGDLCPDPDLVFVIFGGKWYAIECSQILGYTNAAAGYDEKGNLMVNLKLHHELTEFAETCADDMRGAGWLIVSDAEISRGGE